jgi:hypothetical protein
MRFRISITSMMAAILIVALGLAALRINSVLWGGLVLLATLALLCAAAFMSIAGDGPGRLAWIGCAVFGWPCILLGFLPPGNERMGPLRTTDLFEEAIPYINPALDSEIKRLAVAGQKSYAESLPRNLAAISPGFQRYRQSSHSVLTLGFAALGAILGRSRAARRHPAAGTEETGPEAPELTRTIRDNEAR